MRLAIHIPCWQRLELLDVVLFNLQLVADALPHDMAVVVAGSEQDRSREVAERYGADYIEVPNHPLGAKVNAAVRRCRKLEPDGIVGIGSDDLVTAGLFRTWASELAEGYDFIGLVDLYCYELSPSRLVHWPGYTNHRAGETVGVGRCLSRRLMELLDWEPFEPALDRNLDGSMMAKLNALRLKYRDSTFDMHSADAVVVDVKTRQGLSPMPLAPRITEPVTRLRQAFGDAAIDRLLQVSP